MWVYPSVLVLLLLACGRHERSSATATATATTTTTATATATITPPNIILILIDDSGYSDLEGIQVALPHFESFISQSAEFVNAYVTAPQCSPSRVAVLTGQYHQRFGHESNDEFATALSYPNVSIIPRLLPAEYKSAMVGKWK
jgi:arylsulfatase A-like enzyme